MHIVSKCIDLKNQSSRKIFREPSDRIRYILMQVATINHRRVVYKIGENIHALCAHDLFHLESSEGAEPGDEPEEFEGEEKSKNYNVGEKGKQSNGEGFHVDIGNDQEVLHENEGVDFELQAEGRVIERNETGDRHGKMIIDFSRDNLSIENIYC